MARPQKETVQYFSHDADASQGRTLSILFNHFGHEGLSAWWLLLERVSSTRNHVIGIRNPEDIEFLAAKMHFKPDRLMEILSKMADLDAIDHDLFIAGQLWCQHFIDRLAPVYKARGQPLPTKPELSVSETELSVSETTQSKVKYSKDSKDVPLFSGVPSNNGQSPTGSAPLKRATKPKPRQTKLNPDTLQACKDIETWLEQQRGYISPRFAAERKAIITMLADGYPSQAIQACYTHLRATERWLNGKLLSLNYVAQQIGAWRTGGSGDPGPPP